MKFVSFSAKIIKIWHGKDLFCDKDSIQRLSKWIIGLCNKWYMMMLMIYLSIDVIVVAAVYKQDIVLAKILNMC